MVGCRTQGNSQVEKAQVLDLSEVWKYYCELTQTADRSHFSAGEAHLKTNFSRRLYGTTDCIILKQPERQTLLIAKECINVPFSKLMSEHEEPIHIPM